MNTDLLTNLLANDTLKPESEVSFMVNLTYALDNIVPITLFNRGQASRIFSEVKNGGPKVVMKNNEPEAVLLSPEYYKWLMEQVEDYELAQLTLERLENDDPAKTISDEKMMAEFGITREEIDAMEDVEFE